MGLINIDDCFIGEILIDISKQQEFIQSISDQSQDKWLKKLLGRSLYNELLNDLDEDTLQPTSDKFKNLVNGFEYTKDDEIFFYKGIKEMLPYFTYVEICKNNQSFNTSLGNMQGNAENASHVDNRLWVNAYNKGVDLYYEMVEFIYYSNMQVAETYKHFSIQKLDYINSYNF